MRCNSRLGACTTPAAAHGVKGSSGREATRLYCSHQPVPDDSLGSTRTLSHFSASVSGRTASVPVPRSRGRPLAVVSSSIFDPPPFNPAQLTVQFATGACTRLPGPPAPRRYTLTHNDITGALSLTIGQEYNEPQISGFYTRLLRDEVIAEWQHSDDGFPSLHIYCHVSGEERWLAPPQLRDYIFRRELPLVLDTFLHADRQYLREHSNLKSAFVYVHFHSHVPELNQLECWGMLGDRSTWQQIPTSILQRAWLSVIGLAQLAPPQEGMPPSQAGVRGAEGQELPGAAVAAAAADAVVAAALQGAAAGVDQDAGTSSTGSSAAAGAAAGAAAPLPPALAAAVVAVQSAPAAAAAGVAMQATQAAAQLDGAVQQDAAGGGRVPLYSSSAPGVMDGGRAVFADDPELLAAATAELDVAGVSGGSSSSSNGSSSNGNSTGSPGTSSDGHPGGITSSNGNGSSVVGAAVRTPVEAGVGVGAVLPDRATATMLGVSQGSALEGDAAPWRYSEMPRMAPGPLYHKQR